MLCLTGSDIFFWKDLQPHEHAAFNVVDKRAHKTGRKTSIHRSISSFWWTGLYNQSLVIMSRYIIHICSTFLSEVNLPCCWAGSPCALITEKIYYIMNAGKRIQAWTMWMKCEVAKNQQKLRKLNINIAYQMFPMPPTWSNRNITGILDELLSFFQVTLKAEGHEVCKIISQVNNYPFCSASLVTVWWANSLCIWSTMILRHDGE